MSVRSEAPAQQSAPSLPATPGGATPAVVPPDGAPPADVRSIDPRAADARAADALPAKPTSPAGRLLELMSGHWVAQAIHVAAELGLADLVDRRGSTVAELAERSGADPDSLFRLMRALASVGVFAQREPTVFVPTPMSTLLRDAVPGNLRAFARFQGADWHWRSWGGLLDSVKSGRPAIEHALGAADCFDHLEQDADAAQVFDAAMNGYALQVHAAVVDAIDFDGARLIVDVGGGTGGLLVAILARAPDARGIVLDRPSVVEAAQAQFAGSAVGARCEARGGDFFEAVPAGGDVYLLSSVLHDWDDRRAARILGRVARAMAPGARLLIVENLIPDGNGVHPGKLIDLQMMAITTGRERSAAEFGALLATAGLAIARVVSTAVSASIIEAHARR
ncbi:MAG: methyltransferase [Lautropia sp.]